MLSRLGKSRRFLLRSADLCVSLLSGSIVDSVMWLLPKGHVLTFLSAAPAALLSSTSDCTCVENKPMQLGACIDGHAHQYRAPLPSHQTVQTCLSHIIVLRSNARNPKIASDALSSFRLLRAETGRLFSALTMDRRRVFRNFPLLTQQHIGTLILWFLHH